MAKWRQDGGIDNWYKRNGIEPFKKLRQEIPSDPEIEKMLEKWLEDMKYEDEKIAKVHNKEFWIGQAASLRALKVEAERICELDDLNRKKDKI